MNVVSPLESVEAARQSQQKAFDRKRDQAERNRLGQFATPPALAKQLLQVAKGLLPSNTDVRFLDPAVGTGSFYSALVALTPQSKIRHALGFDIDPEVAQIARSLWQSVGLEVRNEDFARATPAVEHEQLANLLICNPPYVRHHHLMTEYKLLLQELAERSVGIKISGLAGLYCYFLAIAHTWMADGCIAGWLIPAEFMDVNYGAPIKRYLLENVTLIRIHRFDPQNLQFDEALVSSAVVWFKNSPPPPEHFVEFTHGQSLVDPEFKRPVESSRLKTLLKWTKAGSPKGDSVGPLSGPTLGDLFKIRRGIATGDNQFFVVPEAKVQALGLPIECLAPVIPSPRNLQSDSIESDDLGLPIVENRRFVINCDAPEDVVAKRWPTLWAYLTEGIEQGVHERYLSRHREPWYSQEKRDPPLFFCTYMTRSNRDGFGFRVILNRSRAIAINVWLMLYPKPFLARRLKAEPDLIEPIWRWMQRLAKDQFTTEGRVYGGGLYKLEPGELANIPAGQLFDEIPELTKSAIEQLDQPLAQLQLSLA